MRIPLKSNRRSARGIALTLLVLLVALGGAAYAVTGTTAPDFTITSSVSTQTVAPGAVTGYGIGLQATGSFSDNVSLSVSGLPANTTASFGTNPAFVDSSLASSSTLWVTTTSSTPTGSSPLTITGVSSNGTQHSTTVMLNVVASSSPDFSIEVTPSTQYVSAGGNVQYSVLVRPINGFSGNVTLSAKTVPGAVSLGWSGVGSVTTAQNPATTIAAGKSATLTVASTTQNPPGSYTVAVTGNSGGIQHSAVVNLNIDLFAATGTVPGQVYPGKTIQIPLTLTNPYNYAVTVTGLAASVQTDPATGYVLDGRTNAPANGCLGSWFKFGPSSLSSTTTLQIPANGSVGLPAASGPSITLTDLPTPQDACKGVVLKLNFVGSGQH